MKSIQTNVDNSKLELLDGNTNQTYLSSQGPDNYSEPQQRGKTKINKTMNLTTSDFEQDQSKVKINAKFKSDKPQGQSLRSIYRRATMTLKGI